MLNPSERRGALVVAALFLIGAAWDVWRAARPAPPAAPPGAGAPAPTADPASERAPESGARPARGGGGPAAEAPDAAPALDLNRASVSELDALPGIGPVLARRIVEHRARHGPFRRVEELRAVRGVGPRLLERLRPRVRCGR
uniref:Helix-hairpin-helix domain-containing protein n=1 Tax=Eiseniibacteriota bacterium TaxID=2212470 RepID=A0A832I0Y6_UNCEI